MADVNVRIRLNNAKIRALTQQGGDVYDWAEDVAAPVLLRAVKARTPIGSGHMHRNMGIRDVQGGGREVTIQIGTKGVPYANRVIRGTGGRAAQYGRDGKNYPIGASMVGRGVPFGNVNRRPGKRVSWARPAMFAKGFSGQAPNNFMREGLRAGFRQLGLY
jgi:hypothetical protein